MSLKRWSPMRSIMSPSLKQYSLYDGLLYAANCRSWECCMAPGSLSWQCLVWWGQLCEGGVKKEVGTG